MATPQLMAEASRPRPHVKSTTRQGRSPEQSHVEAMRGIVSSVILGGLMWALVGLTAFVAF
jgi:hypothetical protein